MHLKKYILKCLHPDCGKEFEDDGFRLQCDGQTNGIHAPALLQANYEKKQLEVRTDLPGVFQFIDWLPVGNCYIDPEAYPLGKPVTYKSVRLAEQLGLKNLYIGFNGYWPEKLAHLQTCTFKEFECQASIVRYLMTYREEHPLPLLISSTGNIANAYNFLTTLLGLPLFLVIPEKGREKLGLPFKTKLFVALVKGDYVDAIELADKIGIKTGLMRDGGVRNVANRAGLGTVMLNAVAHPQQGTQQLFDHYFQAVSSASGAIGAWEAVQLLLEDGRFGTTKTKIHIAQNAPFTPIVDAWEKGERELISVSGQEAKRKIALVLASVLTNRNPAYGIAGGVFDVLKASGGSGWRVTNDSLLEAARLFSESEGIDIDSESAVAVDALRQAIRAGQVNYDDLILLNITGGGREAKYSIETFYSIQPNLIVKPDELELVLETIGQPFPIKNTQALLKRLG